MSQNQPVTPYDGTRQHRPGRVVITRLMFKLQQIPEPNYVIASLLGVHPTTLSQYARGKKSILAHHLEQFCRILECEPEELLGTIEVEVTEQTRFPA